MPKFMNKMVVLAKVETTRGVDAAPTGAANAIFMSDVTWTPLEGDTAERNEVRPFWGNNPTAMVTYYAKVQGSVAYASSGAAGTPPRIDPLLRGCASSPTTVATTSVTYNPVSSAVESVTVYCNIDGKNYKMLDGKGNAKVSAASKGYPKWTVEYTGLWTPITDTAMPTPTYGAQTPPFPFLKANTNVTLHGTVVNCFGWEFDMGMSVVKRDGTDTDSVETTGRKSTGSLKFEDGTIAAKDWVGLAKANTQGPIIVAHGVGAGNIITHTGNVQLGKPTYSEEDGIHMINVPLIYVPTGNGNNEWSFAYT